MAKIALKRGHEMIPHSTILVTVFIVTPSYFFPRRIQRNVNLKMVFRMLEVTPVAPAANTRRKVPALVQEICAKEPPPFANPLPTISVATMSGPGDPRQAAVC